MSSANRFLGKPPVLLDWTTQYSASETRMAATDKILARKEGRVGTLVFNNPERHNAVSLEMWEAASKVLEDFAKDPDVRVLVVAGAGGKAFVSGADISKFGDERATETASSATTAPRKASTPASTASPSRQSPRSKATASEVA